MDPQLLEARDERLKENPFWQKSLQLQNSALNILNQSNIQQPLVIDPHRNQHVSNTNYYYPDYNQNPNQNPNLNQSISPPSNNPYRVGHQHPLMHDRGNNTMIQSQLFGSMENPHTHMPPYSHENFPIESLQHNNNKMNKQKQDQKNSIDFNPHGLDPALVQYKDYIDFENLRQDENEQILKNLLDQEQKIAYNMVVAQNNDEKSMLVQEQLKIRQAIKVLEMKTKERRYQQIRNYYDDQCQDIEKYSQKGAKVRQHLLEKLKNDGDNSEQQHNIEEGFSVIIDFIAGLPKESKQCKINAKLFKKNEQIKKNFYEFQSFCTGYQQHGKALSHSVFSKNNKFFNVEPSNQITVIFEVFTKSREEYFEEWEYMGWTMSEIFDQNLNLQRGMFKIPLYSSPLSNLPFLYIKIAYLSLDSEYGNSGNLNIQQSEHQYITPEIHRDSVFLRNKNMKQQIKMELQRQKQQYNVQMNQKREMMKELYEKKQPNMLEPQFNLKQQPQPIQRNLPSKLKQNEREGLFVTIKNIQFVKDVRNIKVRAFLIDAQAESAIQVDDMNYDCKYETDMYKQIENYNNKLIEDGLVLVDETKHFFTNVEQATKYKNTDFLFLVFHVYQEVRRDESKLGQNQILIYEYMDDKMGYEFIGEEVHGEKNLKNLSGQSDNYKFFTPHGWYCFPLFRKRQLQVGKFMKKMFRLPIRLRPPQDASSLQRTDAKIDFEIGTFIYQKENMKSQKHHYDQIMELTVRNRRENKEK